MAKATANVTIGGSQTDFFVDLTALELEIEADYIMQQAEIEAKNYAQTFGVPLSEGWDEVLKDLENFDSPDYNKNGGLFAGAKTRIQRTIREQTKHMVAKPVEQLSKDKGQLFFWELGIVKSDHCGDCYAHSRMGAKTKAQWLDLGKGLPRWGMTECNIGCRCMLRPTSQGSGTTKISKKAVTKGVNTAKLNKGLGNKIQGVVKGAPLTKGVKDKVKEKTKEIKKEIKEQESKLPKDSQEMKNKRVFDNAYQEAVKSAKRIRNADERRRTLKSLERNMHEALTGTAMKGESAFYIEKFITPYSKEYIMTRGASELVNRVAGGGAYSMGRTQNHWLKQFLKEENKFGKATKMSPADFDAMMKKRKNVDHNGKVYFRGTTTSKRDAESLFRGGDTWIGKGVYGDGIYSAFNMKGKGSGNGMGTALSYAGNGGQSVYNDKGWIIKFTLKKDTKIATQQSIEKAMFKELRKIIDEKGDDNFFARGKHMRPENFDKYGHFYDSSTWALSKGIDAVQVSNRGFMIVLNRSKMIMADTAGKAKLSDRVSSTYSNTYDWATTEEMRK